MGNQYEVHTSNGKVYDVDTPEHHDDHTHESFKAHLGRVIDGAIGGTLGGVATILIRKYVFKGKV